MFIGYDPWEEHHFKKYKDELDVLVPVDDVSAYTLDCEYNWVYNKVNLYELQHLNFGYNFEDLIRTVKRFPVVVKPAFNLYGMGKDARICDTPDIDFAPGEIWMEHLKGEHVSTDIALYNGKIIAAFHALGVRNNIEDVSQWAYWKVLDGEIMSVLSIIKAFILGTDLSYYTGMLNIEMIGPTIIEVHLRFSSQFVDLYPRDFVNNVHNLYNNIPWIVSEPKQLGYSVPVFHSGPFDENDIPKLPGHPDISITCTHKDVTNKYLNVPRVMVINGKKLESCLRLKEYILQALRN